MGHDELIGKTLRQYLVTGHIGQGGMGDVWKARDTVLERDVALKVLLAHDSAAIERKERFAREARAASALNHPNIITIYEINSDQGIDFIAMEYVRGQTLGLILRAGPLPVERVVGYALQIAEAVGRAHGAGIVHRDLKPGNIMVTDDDDLVKVLDFGLAKVARPASHEAESPADAATRLELTRPGTSSGTFGYMSPEQSVGDAIDARSDVFSFGVVMYEMLAGQRPFEATSRVDALKQLHFSTPEPVTSVRPDTPPAIAAIVSRALQKRPSDRYANLTQVATALRMALSTVPVSSVGAEPAAQPSHRRRYAIMSAVGASAIVIGAIVIGAVAWQSRAIDRNGASQVGTPPARESAGVYELTQNAAGLLARQDIPDNVDQAIAFLEQALALDRDSAAAHSTLSTAYLRKNQINPDPQWAALARQSAERAVAINADLAIAQQALGFVRLEAGDRVEAAERFRRAVDLDPMSSLPHMGLGLIAAAENREAEAEAAFQKAVQLGPKLWRPRLEYGQFHFRRARYAEAVAQWEAAETTTPDNVLVLRSLGAAYFLLDRPDEAASILQRALEARPSAAIYTNLGTIRFFQRRYADAVEAFEKAVELGANNQQFWGNLGDGLRWAPGRRPEAAAAYRRASELIQQQIADTPDDPDLRSRHALYLIKVGDRAAALREIAGVVNRSDLNAQMHYRLAVIHELAGDRTQALAALERSLKAGYAAKDLPNEPELVAMRADARYHRMVDAFKTPGNR